MIVLAENDVAYDVARKICDDLHETLGPLNSDGFPIPQSPLKRFCARFCLTILKGSGEESFFKVLDERRSEHKPAVVLFVGVNGTGKTSSIAKIGHLAAEKGFSVVIAAADTYRTGSIEQIEEHARRIGIKTIKHDYGGDAAAVAFDAVNYANAHGTNVVLIDTAGRMQTNKNLLEEMKKIARVAKPEPNDSCRRRT